MTKAKHKDRVEQASINLRRRLAKVEQMEIEWLQATVAMYRWNQVLRNMGCR